MFLQNNTASMHALPIPNSNTSDPVAQHSLFPGPNEIPDSLWATLKSHPVVQQRIKSKTYQVIVKEKQAPTAQRMKSIIEESANLSDLRRWAKGKNATIARHAQNRLTFILTPPKDDE